jgi:hypothetical protein
MIWIFASSYTILKMYVKKKMGSELLLHCGRQLAELLLLNSCWRLGSTCQYVKMKNNGVAMGIEPRTPPFAADWSNHLGCELVTSILGYIFLCILAILLLPLSCTGNVRKSEELWRPPSLRNADKPTGGRCECDTATTLHTLREQTEYQDLTARAWPVQSWRARHGYNLCTCLLDFWMLWKGI